MNPNLVRIGDNLYVDPDEVVAIESLPDGVLRAGTEEMFGAGGVLGTGILLRNGEWVRTGLSPSQVTDKIRPRSIP